MRAGRQIQSLVSGPAIENDIANGRKERPVARDLNGHN